MSAADLAKRRLPSPPSSLNGDYPFALSHIAQHNATVPHRPEPFAYHEGSYGQSGQSTSYGSPASNHWLVDEYGREPYQSSYGDPEHVGLGINYGWYEGAQQHQNQAIRYHTMLPEDAMYADQRFSAGSPPTPAASDLSSGEQRLMRSGRALGVSGLSRSQKTSAPDRAAHLPRNKKASKQSKADKPKIPKIDAPLSELTKSYDHIPLRNMEEWVNRPADVRMKEVEKRNGYVTRPMNSFMLYRSAFAERTKLWCLQNNHQVVSSISGESWPMEPPAIREQYNEYARIERDNHQKAHPGYKFSPSKAQNSARKRKGMSEEIEEEELSDREADFDWRPSSERRSKTRAGRRQGREAGYPVNSTLHGNAVFNPLYADSGINRSSYQATNPGKPLPVAMSEQDLYGHYYQTTVHPSLSGPNMEDVRIRKTATPGMQSGNAPPLIGLPGAHHYELLENEPFDSSLVPPSEAQVDPTLLAYDSSFADQANGFITEQQFREYNEDILFGADTQLYGQPDGAAFPPEPNTWPFGEIGATDADEEFARWMTENNDR